MCFYPFFFSLGLILRGWIDLRSTKEQHQKKSIKYFDEALNSQHSVKEIDALLGKIEYFKLKNNFTGALEIANQLIVMYPDFYPGLMEKMAILIALQVCMVSFNYPLYFLDS